MATPSSVSDSRTMQGGRRILAVAVATLSVSACSGARPRAAGRPPTTPVATSTSTSTVAPSTTTTTDPTKEAILAAYRAHWDDVIAVSGTFPVNPLAPRLASHATGKQLTSEQQALTRISLLNRYESGTLDLAPIVTSVIGDTATVTDCDFDHAVEVDGRTGAPVETPDVGHSLLRFTLARIAGVWFVSDSTIVKSGKTVDSCSPGAL